MAKLVNQYKIIFKKKWATRIVFVGFINLLRKYLLIENVILMNRIAS